MWAACVCLHAYRQQSPRLLPKLTPGSLRSRAVTVFALAACTDSAARANNMRQAMHATQAKAGFSIPKRLM